MEKMKIVVLDGYTLNPGDLSWEGLQKTGNVKIYDHTKNDVHEVLKAIGDAEIVLTNKTILNKEILEKAPNIKYIGVLATGYNVVDIKTAIALNIVVTNVPAYSTEAVAQMTMALLLELTNKVGLHDRAVKEGEWMACRDFSFLKSQIIDLNYKTIGLIGFGQIGQATARIALAFGMKVLVLNHRKKKVNDSENGNIEWVSFEELLKRSDVISLHCPLTESTKGIMNKESISLMKEGAMLINTARGELIDENDLKEALDTGKLAGAALDVISQEPMPNNYILLNTKNCIITPHIAWASIESRSKLMSIAIDNLKAYLNGNPENVVS